MPELPEVETTRRGIAPHIEDRVVTAAVVRQPQLRWPVPALAEILPGQTIRSVTRRAKYLLVRCEQGTLVIHLGMSGSLRILPANTPPGPHDHVDIVVGQSCLRLRDPRRFGAIFWTSSDPLQHERLVGLGPEPLSPEFDADYLYSAGRHRTVAIKNLIMNGAVVVGVGNIYASESLFRAGIRPARASNRIARERYARLVGAIKQILTLAIAQGGTTLRDFQREDGRPGYFKQDLRVYGRDGQPCFDCGATLKLARIGQRASVYCPNCQR